MSILRSLPVLVLVLLGGCASEPLDSTTAPPAPVDACTAAGGTCSAGPCAVGTVGAPGIAQAHPGACGGGACCVPDTCSSHRAENDCEAAGCDWQVCPPNADCVFATQCVADCRLQGCAQGSTCQPCWGGYACLSEGAVC